MRFLTRDEILKIDDLKREAIDIPEWGGSICVRELTGAERSELFALWKQDESDEKQVQDSFAIIVATVRLTACGEDGKPLFTADDILRIRNLNAKVLDKIYKEAAKMNGFGADGIEEAKKSAEPMANGVSGIPLL